MLAFNRPIALGSLVFPREANQRMKISVLKADAPYPPLAYDDSQWQTIPQDNAVAGWDVVTMPEQMVTRALRLTFIKASADNGDADLLDAKPTTTQKQNDLPSLDLPQTSGGAAPGAEFGSDTGAWNGQIEGMKMLRRRFKNVAPQAKVSFNSGAVGKDGVWNAQRKDALTEQAPGIYALEWEKSQTLRGLAIKEVDGELTKIDVFEGPADAAIDIKSDKGWREVAQYSQKRRNFNLMTGRPFGQARYMDGYVDFGTDIKTRAVRLRVVKQWTDGGQDNSFGVRGDLGGNNIEANRCRVFGVAALGYLGKEPPVDELLSDRIECYDGASGKLVREFYISNPGKMAFDKQGRLHVISGDRIVRIGEGDKPVAVATDLINPVDLAFDSKGAMYVVDNAPSRYEIRVYDAKGKFQRTIGKSGPLAAGPWDPERLGAMADIDIDSSDQLWVVHGTYLPKRITQWTSAGKFIREHLGNTQYGGAGVLDPYDKSRVCYGPLEFEIDWKTGHSRLKNFTWAGTTPAGEQPIRIKDRMYMVNRPEMFTTRAAIVYLYEKDHLKLAAAIGAADSFDPLKQPTLIIKAGASLATLKFIWSDLNGNGEVDADEVEFSPKPGQYGQPNAFDRTLGIQVGNLRYQVKEFLPNGVPIYEEVALTQLPNRWMIKQYDGNFHERGADGHPETGWSAEGKKLWTYPATGAGGHAFFRSSFYTREENVSELSLAGHEPAGKDPIGEFMVFHTYGGAWNIWTADGLYCGSIFREIREPGVVPWSMKQHERGMMLTDVSAGQEHFQAYVCRSIADNKYYAVAGHNHISVVEILGLDKARRTSGKFKVTAKDLQKVQEWESKTAKREVYARTPVIDCYRLRKAPPLDGSLGSWPAAAANIEKNAELHIGFNATHLFVGFATHGLGPMKNTGTQWDRMFKTGAAVDLHWGADPEAPFDRQSTVAGDTRLLMSVMNGKPIAVLYRPVSPQADSSLKWEVVSPIGRAAFDEVRVVKDVQMVFNGSGDGYEFKAAIPLAELDWDPHDGQRLRMDWGMLVSGPDGNEVLRRLYWSNKATAIVSDAPSEAILQPQMWGALLVHEQNQLAAESQINEQGVPEKKKTKEVTQDVDDILDAIKEKKR